MAEYDEITDVGIIEFEIMPNAFDFVIPVPQNAYFEYGLHKIQ